MDKNEIIESTTAYVKKQLAGEGSGHDWWHIHRVTELTKKIAIEEDADLFICTMAALLHDIADEKLNSSETLGIKKVRGWLESQLDSEEEIEIIMEIITTISFKGGTMPPVKRLEAKVLQDADRLDAIGAIGIARCFTYGGSVGSIIFDPNVPPRTKMTKEAYRDTSKSTSINHFYEKLLKLKDLMNTETGRQLAIERHQFMEDFLKAFLQEWSQQ